MLILFHKNSYELSSFDLSLQRGMPGPSFRTSFCVGRSPSNSIEAGRTPQEAQTRKEVRLTLVKLDKPKSNWFDTNKNYFSFLLLRIEIMMFLKNECMCSK